MLKVLYTVEGDWEDKYFQSQNLILFSKNPDLYKWNSFMLHSS